MTQTQETMDAPARVSDLGKAVAVIERGGHMLAIPDNLNQQIEFAKTMCMAGPMIGKPFRNNPGACLAIANQAWQWGMNPFAVSQKAYLVNDVIGFEAQLVAAVIIRLAPLSKRPRYSFEGEGDKRRCTVTFWVKGEDEPLTYTSPEFSKIQPKNSPLWKTDPDQQQSYYTGRAGARRYFPEVLMGVLDYEEAVFVAEQERKASAPVTLSGGAVNAASEGEPAIDADFTDGTAVLDKNAKKKAKATKAESPPDPKAESPPDPKAESPPDPKAADEAKPVEPAKAEEKPKEPPAAEGQGSDEIPHDEKLLSDLEATLKATPRGKVPIIKANRAWLERIREIPENDDHFARADKILSMFDLDE